MFPFVGLLIFSYYSNLQEDLVRPSDVMAFMRDTSGRRNAVLILLMIVGPAFGLMLKELWLLMVEWRQC
jgi:hypothetical protein